MADLAALELIEAKIKGTWPLSCEAKTWALVNQWRAFREADGERIKPRDWDTDRPYIVDPIAGRISEAFADLIFGEDPVFTAADESMQDRLDEIVEGNALPSELQVAEAVCSSEGDVWYRIFRDEAVADHPLIDWHSRGAVIPLFAGRRLRAVAFWSQLTPEKDKSERYRVFEIHAEGITRSLLFRGTDATVGDRVDLASHADTEGIEEDWNHDLPMLAGRVINRVGSNRTAGISDYKAVRDLLYTLNEAVTIGSENARMTLKQRAVVPASYLDATGKLPAGKEVLINTEVDQNPDKPGAQLAQIEWSFDAEAWIAWHSSLTDTILTRSRVAPQLVGRNTGNTAPESGTAFKMKLIDTTMAANGKARAWDSEIPIATGKMQQVDALPVERGGFGNVWPDATANPSVERESTLPEDDRDEAERVVIEVTAEVLSRQSGIEELHPEWDEDRVKEELKRIHDEQEAQMPDHLSLPNGNKDPNGQTPGGDQPGQAAQAA